MTTLPPCPASLKPIQHYLKTAAEHESRDIVVVYWCRLFSVQSALTIDKKSDEAKLLLAKLIEWLELKKREHKDNEAITNDLAAQAHLENYALKLFNWADGQDQNGIFNKNVVKAFYTAGMLMDVLNTFGELPDEIESKCKYAKWKAAYIHNCLRSGETPVPGGFQQNEFTDQSVTEKSLEDELNEKDEFEEGRDPTFNANTPPPSAERSSDFTERPSVIQSPAISAASSFQNIQDIQRPSLQTSGGVKLEPTQITKAQKYCKFATSALNYDDIPEAINNLQKALKLLTTGEDS